MAMLIQVLSAKLGIATGKTSRNRSAITTRARWYGFIGYRRKLSPWRPIWLNLSVRPSALSCCSAFPYCRGGADRCRDFPDPDVAASRAETAGKVIGGLLLFVAAAYVVELIFSQPALAPLTKGMVIPSLPNGEAVFLAAGVLGATIMPHVIYLHSSLTQNLHDGSRKERYNATRWDVAIAMTIAGFVNGDDGDRRRCVSLQRPHRRGRSRPAYLTLEPLLSHAAATVLVSVWLPPVSRRR